MWRIHRPSFQLSVSLIVWIQLWNFGLNLFLSSHAFSCDSLSNLILRLQIAIVFVDHQHWPCHMAWENIQRGPGKYIMCCWIWRHWGFGLNCNRALQMSGAHVVARVMWVWALYVIFLDKYCGDAIKQRWSIVFSHQAFASHDWDTWHKKIYFSSSISTGDHASD